MRDAQNDDERPARYALVRAVLDWYRTGVGQPCPTTTATGLLRVHLAGEAEPAEVNDAFRWALESVTGAVRTRQSLLTETPPRDTVTVHEYVQDADARAGSSVVPDDVWGEALHQAATNDARFSVGLAAAPFRRTAALPRRPGLRSPARARQMPCTTSGSCSKAATPGSHSP